MGLMRIVIAFLAFTPFIFYFFKKINWSKWKLYLLIGVTGNAIPAFMYAIAQTEITSIASGILNSLTPLFTIVFGLLFFNVKSNIYQGIGVTLGLLGAVLIIAYGSQLDLGSNPAYGLFVVIGTMCYAMNSNFIKTYLQDEDPLLLAAVSFLLIGVPFVIIALCIGIPANVMQSEAAQLSLMYLTLLSIMSTVFSLIIYYYLLQRTTALFASSVTYTMPAIVLFWGIFDGEALVMFHLIGLGLIIGGVYLIRK